MKLAIVGSREYPRMDLLVNFISRDLQPDTVVVSGGARGVDSIAVTLAEARGMQTEVLRADWDQHGKAAGYMRNTDIVEAADQVVAFWDGESSGTYDTITKARAAGKLAWVIGPDGKLMDLGAKR